jgi:hypothetical protein
LADSAEIYETVLFKRESLRHPSGQRPCFSLLDKRRKPLGDLKNLGEACVEILDLDIG